MWSMVLVAKVTMASVCTCPGQLLIWRQSDRLSDGKKQKKMQMMMLASSERCDYLQSSWTHLWVHKFL